MAACTSCGAETPSTARYCPDCGARVAPDRESLRVITALFCDVVDSTPITEGDPEAARRVISGYFDEVRAVIARHGGMIEKFIGDEVFGVFGVPQAHEDDALRAARAAVDIRSAVAALNGRLASVRLSVRIGVNTGQVVAGDPSTGHGFLTGDAVVVGKRLEQVASPGEILIGGATYALVRDAVLVEDAGEIALKGKTAPVAAKRLLAVLSDVPGVRRRFGTELVGRERELALLRHAFESARQYGRGHLFTLLGPAGVGKSRLVRELVAEVEDRATVLAGRCLAYGEGITFWPMLDVVRQAAGIPANASPESAQGRIRAVLGESTRAESVAAIVAGAVGVTEAAGTALDSFWAFRRLLEAVARERPLVLIFDDVHWGEPTFLDLVEYLGEAARDEPMLIVCLARPELLELRPTWGGGRPNATSVLLEPLGDDDASHLIDALAAPWLDESARKLIVAAAEGNPFYIEEMVAVSRDGVSVPPTIQALLAARLDNLEADERAVVEAAAVAGKSFRARAVEALVGDGRIDTLLESLARKELLRRLLDSPEDDPWFRFRHILIRDAAYDATPKQRRAELHRRFAEWRAAGAGDRIRELEEILGYHFEQAYRLRTELGDHDEETRRLAVSAGGYLASAGGRALGREDIPAAVSLLERASRLLAGDLERLSPVLLDLGSALRESGDLVRSDAVITEAIEAATAAEQPHLRSRALVEQSSLHAYVDPDVKADDLLRVARAAIAVCERSGDALGLAKAWIHVADVQWMRCHCGEMEDALETALLHAETAGARRERSWALGSIARAALLGPRPVDAAIERCEWARERARGDVGAEARIDSCTAVLESMVGHREAAADRFARTTERLEEAGLTMLLASCRMYAGIAELISGDHDAAARELRSGYETLERVGERGHRSTMAAFLARALYELEQYDEAEELTGVSESTASRDDIGSQVIWRGTRGKLLARRGDEAADELAREAVALSAETDFVNVQADAFVDLAETMRLLGRPEDERLAAEQAVALYEAKGNGVSAAAARRLLPEPGRAAGA